jgi:alanyl-tRNA synthetase
VREAFIQFFERRKHVRQPSARLIPDDPSVLLTMAGMLPYKPCFLGQKRPPAPAVTSSQRCVRTDDLSNVGATSRHLSFFEMLGAFSFGAYFKQSAIAFAYELATSTFSLNPERIWISVLAGDSDAHNLWQQCGIPPDRIQQLGPDENFWSSGPTGPCGPCSEMHFDFFPERGTSGADLANDEDRFLEFYNLVFIESDRLPDGSLRPLENKCVDTGLGLERLVQILQNTSSPFETDFLSPLVESARSMRSSLSASAHSSENVDADADRQRLRVVADHTRALVHLIGDGVAFSNTGRGYVARRLCRRAVREARLAGLRKGAITSLVPNAIDLAAEADPELAERARQKAEMAIKREEDRFNATLERGEKVVEKVLAEARDSADKTISGERAFELYDAHGFPMELTREAAAAEGIAVHEEGFKMCMEAQRERARQASGPTAKLREEFAAGEAAPQQEDDRGTNFLGYEMLERSATLNAIAWRTENEKGTVVLDETPFYPEGGGQIADTGTIVCEAKGAVARVRDVQIGSNSGYEHAIEVVEGGSTPLEAGDHVIAKVDVEARRRAAMHHTATHLLNAALRELLGEGVTQAGSLVDTDRLRFDFTCPRDVSADDLQRVEDRVNEWIVSDLPISTREMHFEDAREEGACFLPGEEYMEHVRVVSVAEGVSLELCGGTHAKSTGELGGLRLTSEEAIAAGVTRVEAVAGPALADLARHRDESVRQTCSELKCNADTMVERVRSLADARAHAEQRSKELSQQLAAVEGRLIASDDCIEKIGPSLSAVIAEVDSSVGTDCLRDAANAAVNQLGEDSVAVIAIREEQKASIAVAVSKSAADNAGVHAGKLASDAAQEIGGGGGGKPQIAQAGGKDSDRLPEALQRAREWLMANVTEPAAAA